MNCPLQYNVERDVCIKQLQKLFLETLVIADRLDPEHRMLNLIEKPESYKKDEGFWNKLKYKKSSIV